MSRLEFLSVLFNFFSTAIIAGTIGLGIINLFLRLFRIKPTTKTYRFEILSVSFPVGMGFLAYISLLLGLLGLFQKSAIILASLIFFLLFIKNTRTFFSYLTDLVKSVARGFVENKWLIVVFIPTILILGSLYLSSMQPPYAQDELHYHFPQSQQIVDNQRVDIKFGGHYFYGNIPKLMEIIFAAGIAISGYSLAHAYNFALFLSFISLVFAVIGRFWGLKAAIFSSFFLAAFDDFTWNATTGYIDAATTGLEIGALLLFSSWIVKKDQVLFLLSSLLLGFALSMKYSPLPMLAFIGISLLLILVKKVKSRKEIVKNLLIFTLPILVFAGFWYLKNLILLKNPFYPLYFGHEGLDEPTYRGLISAIEQFGPKTPNYFFSLISHYLTVNGITVYLSFYIALLAFFIRKYKPFVRTILAYYLLYTLYWFFIATHQIRFLMPAIVAAIILTSIVVSKIKTELLIISILILSLFFKDYWKHYWDTKLHVPERQYALGNIDKAEFLTRQFGCQYKIIEYLEKNNLSGAVVDNWSVWHAPSVSFYAKDNRFTTLGLNVNQNVSQALEVSERANAKYIYFNEKVKETHLQDPDPLVIESKLRKLPLEEYLLNKSNLIYASDDCRLYEINYSN